MKKRIILLVGLFLFIWNLNPIQKQNKETIITYNHKNIVDQNSIEYLIPYFNGYLQDNLIINNIVSFSTLSTIQHKESMEETISINQIVKTMITYVHLKTIGLMYNRSRSYYFNISLFNNTTKLGRT